jgi:hypothetical protein
VICGTLRGEKHFLDTTELDVLLDTRVFLCVVEFVPRVTEQRQRGGTATESTAHILLQHDHSLNLAGGVLVRGLEVVVARGQTTHAHAHAQKA